MLYLCVQLWLTLVVFVVFFFFYSAPSFVHSFSTLCVLLFFCVCVCVCVFICVCVCVCSYVCVCVCLFICVCAREGPVSQGCCLNWIGELFLYWGQRAQPNVKITHTHTWSLIPGPGRTFTYEAVEIMAQTTLAKLSPDWFGCFRALR